MERAPSARRCRWQEAYDVVVHAERLNRGRSSVVPSIPAHCHDKSVLTCDAEACSKRSMYQSCTISPIHLAMALTMSVMPHHRTRLRHSAKTSSLPRAASGRWCSRACLRPRRAALQQQLSRVSACHVSKHNLIVLARKKLTSVQLCASACLLVHEPAEQCCSCSYHISSTCAMIAARAACLLLAEIFFAVPHHTRHHCQAAEEASQGLAWGQGAAAV